MSNGIEKIIESFCNSVEMQKKAMKTEKDWKNSYFHLASTFLELRETSSALEQVVLEEKGEKVSEQIQEMAMDLKEDYLQNVIIPKQNRLARVGQQQEKMAEEAVKNIFSGMDTR